MILATGVRITLRICLPQVLRVTAPRVTTFEMIDNVSAVN